MSSFHPEAFGKYYLVDKIATGGMAEIFKAKTFSHGGFENLLVIKRILAHLGDNEEFVEMFIDEAKVSVALQHANVIRIYDFGKILDNYFIAMECVDGKDVRAVLRKLAKKRRFLPIEFAAYVAHEVCKGLYYAHSKSDLHGRGYDIVHRDISPSNILIAYEGDTKIADFGIAKAEQNTYSTKDGVLKGKFEYMSPEQASGEEMDARSDLFSLGIILYEMLTGRRLFKTGSDTATLERIKKADVVPPSQINARVPERLERIVMRALARRPEDRYQSAKEMQDDLLEFLFPATPDAICQSLSRFMQALFQEEIAAERQRLQEGSQIAVTLHEQQTGSPDGWEGTTNSTMKGLPPTRRRVLPLALVLLLFLFLGVGLTASAVVLLGWFALPADTGPPAVAALPTVGSLDVMVMPEARVTLDGKDRGVTGNVTVSDLAPGQHTLRLEAEGHEPWEQAIEVVAGETAKVQEFLTRLPEAPSEPDTEEVSSVTPVTTVRRVAAGPARVRFESDPPGALVLVDNQIVGKTPFTWTGGGAGRTYDIEYQLSGYPAVRGKTARLAAGNTVTFSKRFQKGAAVPGALSIAVIGGGWANIFVDGNQLDKTAPLRDHKLAPGTYTVRVVNPDIGMDYRQVITVASGETVKINAKAN